MWACLRYAVGTVATAVAISGAASGSARAIALDQCVDASFGSGALACTVPKNTVFAGLDATRFPGPPTGEFMASGNDHEIDVEAGLNHVFGHLVDVTPVATKIDRLITGDIEITPKAGGPDSFGAFTGFDWSYSGSDTLSFLTVKAGTAFAILDIQDLTSGFATTADLLTNQRGLALGISHVSFWGIAQPPIPTGPVGPERLAVASPGILALAGGGLLGIAMLRRRV